MNHRPLLLSLAIATAPVVFSAAAFAQEPVAAEVEASPATDFVRERADAILLIVNSAAADPAAVATKREELRGAIRAFLSFDVLAERTLGDTWEARTPEERAEFVALLRDLIETSYLRSVGSDTVDQSAYAVTYTGERSRRDRYTVEGTVTVDGDTHLIEVKLQSTDAGFVVYDLVTDDVSLEESYAESFASIIAEDGWAGLLTRMRERLAEMQAEL